MIVRPGSVFCSRQRLRIRASEAIVTEVYLTCTLVMDQTMICKYCLHYAEQQVMQTPKFDYSRHYDRKN
ncbi:hypothetical protein FHG87_024859 [Trinorchestia longiramus]|nr:hypothetical protein FHG87_024859 [Trinorchestia longiramus]